MRMGDFGADRALFAELDRVIAQYARSPDALIQVLHHAQGLFGYLREDVLNHVAHALRIPISKVYGVVTFYHFFTMVPRGRHNIRVCLGTACYVRGASTAVCVAKVPPVMSRERSMWSGR